MTVTIQITAYSKRWVSKIFILLNSIIAEIFNMSTIEINGLPQRIDFLEGCSRHDQNEIMTIWFMNNFDRVSFDERLIFDSVKDDEVEAIDVLTKMFGAYVPEDVIAETAAELDRIGDEIWVPAIDYSVYWQDSDREPDAYEVFQTSITRIYKMKENADKLGGAELQQYLFQILYANVFTTFEAYMVRAFINKLFESNEILRMYLEKQKEFKFENPRLIDLLKGHDHLEQFMESRRKDIKVELAKASWHDLEKVPARFNCLGIDLKISASGLYHIIQKRNDIVHRNGLTIHDEAVVINDDELNKAIEITCSIAHAIRAHELGFEDLNKTGEF